MKPLSDAEADKLILALHPGLEPDARRAVQERCDGIPLYIEEVVAKLKEQASDADESAQVPDTLYEALFARLRSSTNALFVVEAAALIGSRFDRRLLSSVVEMDKRKVDDVLQRTRARPGAPAGRQRQLALPPRASARGGRGTLAAQSFGADCTAESPMPSSPQRPTGTRNGRWWHTTTNEPSVSTRRHRPTSRRRPTHGSEARSIEARSHLTRALENVERWHPVRRVTGMRSPFAWSAGSSPRRRRATQAPRPPPSSSGACSSSETSRLRDVRDLQRAVELLHRPWRSPPGDAAGGGAAGSSGHMPEWYRRGQRCSRGVLASVPGRLPHRQGHAGGAAAELDHGGSPEIEERGTRRTTRRRAMYALARAYPIHPGRPGRRRDRLCADGTPVRKAALSRNGAFSLCYGRAMETWIRVEAGEFDRAAELIEEVARRGEQHGFDEWVGIAACNHVALVARTALVAGAAEPAALQPHIENMTAVVETWRASEVKTFLAFYDGFWRVAHRRRREAARRANAWSSRCRWPRKPGWRIYDAELLRSRAHTFDDPDARHRRFRAAIELAQNQGAPIFELRCGRRRFRTRRGAGAGRHLSTH